MNNKVNLNIRMSLNKATLDFLSDLEQNNNREWFQDHKHLYKRAWQEMKEFTGKVIHGVAAFDPHIHTAIDPGKCLFRIYRDVRFRKDKTPYKTWFGAGISVNGRKLHGPEYYYHIQPGASFLAVGYWRPEKDHLAAIRQEIDYNGDEWRTLLAKISEKVGSPIEPDRDDVLVRPPAGFPADHPELEYLKLKSFTLSIPLADRDVLRDNIDSMVVEYYQAMHPFKEFLHRAIGD